MKLRQKRINSDFDESDISVESDENDIEYVPKRFKSDLSDNFDDIDDIDDIDLSCKSKTCTHNNKQNNNSKLNNNDKLNNNGKLNNILSLQDLINLGLTYNCISNKELNGINLRILNNLIDPLTELNSMIGLAELKNNLINQILYICRGYNSIKCNKCIDCHLKIPCCSNSKEMMHTVITGPPGVGKTEFARILSKIYARCGFVKHDKMIEVTRADLVSGYLGRTAKKTTKIFKRAKNGVLFIDEAYALGNTGDQDSYSKECIDIINKQLSERKDVICIIAGYKEEIESCFFRVNKGLERRFTFRYNISGYSGEELFKIFESKIKNDHWTLNEKDYERIKKYIINNVKKYTNFAGDMTTLLIKAKIKNARNINSTNYVITLDDIIV